MQGTPGNGVSLTHAHKYAHGCSNTAVLWQNEHFLNLLSPAAEPQGVPKRNIHIFVMTAYEKKKKHQLFLCNYDNTVILSGKLPAELQGFHIRSCCAASNLSVLTSWYGRHSHLTQFTFVSPLWCCSLQVPAVYKQWNMLFSWLSLSDSEFHCRTSPPYATLQFLWFAATTHLYALDKSVCFFVIHTITH